MEQFFTAAWQNKASWLWLLLPFAWLYRLISWLNKKAYAIGLKKIYYPPVPVIVIGNITVGGSGKTPLIIALVRYLQAKPIQVAVISRGYGGDTSQMPCLVTPQSTPAQVGDEPCLIVQSTQGFGKVVPMAVCPNRGQAIDLLLQHFPNTQLILADDGLQHYALDRDKNWIVVDGDRGLGNQQVLPVGFLREPIKRLFQPDTTVIFHQKNWQISPPLLKRNLGRLNAQLLMKLAEQPLQPLFPQSLGNALRYYPAMPENFGGVHGYKDLIFLPYQKSHLTPNNFPQVIAMTGIGYPQRFFDSLTRLGFEVIKKAFNDHHNFSLSDFDFKSPYLPHDVPIVVTAKDAVKIRLLLQADTSTTADRLKSRLWVLPVVATLSDTVWQELDRQLAELGIEICV